MSSQPESAEQQTKSTVLLARVARRLRVVAAGNRLYSAFLALCIVYSAVYVVGWMLGVLSEWYHPMTLVAIPVLALLVSLFVHRRPSSSEAARAIDSQRGSKDLFLTYALIDDSVGTFKPLVTRDADKVAPSVKPVEVVPFHWLKRAAHTAVALLIVLAVVNVLPRFDPFGHVAAAEQTQERKRELTKSTKATMLRAAALKRDESDGEESKEVKKAIENLKSTFRKMKVANKQGNSKLLNADQKSLGKKWRKMSAEQLKQLLVKNSLSQQFGGASSEKLQKWTRELQQGSTKSLQKQLAEMKKDLKMLAQAKDPVEKAKLLQELKRKLRDLEEFASTKVDSKPLAAALKRAMKQLEMAKLEGDGSEAMDAAMKSLDLAKMELVEIQQSAKDLKALEEALQALQMAKSLNNEDRLDGEACEECQSLADYAELYAQMMAGVGDGEGLGGEGRGRGDVAPEEDLNDSGFKTERSKSAVVAGKILLSMKTKGLSDRGDAKQDYSGLVKQVKQGMNEAILLEQIPPGYHDGIKLYFDSIDADADNSEQSE